MNRFEHHGGAHGHMAPLISLEVLLEGGIMHTMMADETGMRVGTAS